MSERLCRVSESCMYFVFRLLQQLKAVVCGYEGAYECVCVRERVRECVCVCVPCECGSSRK